MFQASDIFGLGAVNAKGICESPNEIADILNFFWLGIISGLSVKNLVSMEMLNSLHLRWSPNIHICICQFICKLNVFEKITRFSMFNGFNFQGTWIPL